MGDSARALTDEGREEMREHARKVAGHVGLEGILTSPAVRAVQTAEILAEACGVDQVVVRGELAFERASRDTIAGLARELGVGWALVGHNPSFGETVPRLLGLRKDAVRFRKGGAMGFAPRPDGARWELRFVADPGEPPRETLDADGDGE